MSTTTVKNLGGGHNLADGTVVGHGETFEHEGDFDALCKKFPNKFERCHKAETGGTATADDRQDVTTEFPEAAEAGLTVLKDKKGWSVYDEGDEPIEGTPCTKGKVKAAIEKYLAD